MRRTSLHLSTSLAFLVLAPAMGADWPMYLMDLSHTSYAASETQLGPDNVGGLQPAWTFKGHYFGGAPTIVGGVIYIGDWSGSFYAINATDGTPVWQQFAGMSAPPLDPDCQPATGVTGQAVVKDGVVYVPGGDSAVYAFDQTTGSQLWRVPLADPDSGSYLWSSLSLVNNSIFVGVSSLGDCPLVRGAMARVDLADPQNPLIKYLVADGDVGVGVWSTPAVDTATNAVYVTTGNGTQDATAPTWGSAMLALDPRTLEVSSHFFVPTYDDFDDNDFGSSPVLFQTSDGTPLVAATGKDGVLYALRRSDLTPYWIAPLSVGCDNPQAGCGSLSTPAFDGTRLYVGAGQWDMDSFDLGSVYAFDPSTGEQLWLHAFEQPVIAPVTVANGVVYVATGNGVAALDASTGDKLWDDGNAGLIYSQPVVVDGTLYAAYFSGDLVAYRLPPAQSSAGAAKPRR